MFINVADKRVDDPLMTRYVFTYSVAKAPLVIVQAVAAVIEEEEEEPTSVLTSEIFKVDRVGQVTMRFNKPLAPVNVT